MLIFRLKIFFFILNEYMYSTCKKKSLKWNFHCIAHVITDYVIQYFVILGLNILCGCSVWVLLLLNLCFKKRGRYSTITNYVIQNFTMKVNSSI